MNILVLVAHPDDEAIMCGGTLDKLIKAKHAVYVSYFTRNDQAFFGTETQKERQKRAVDEAKRSAKLLGYQTNFLKYKDMEIQANEGVIIQSAIKEIRRTKPDVIITHHTSDKHIDHRTLGKLVPEANFQSGCNLCGGEETWIAQAILQGEIDLEMTNQFNFDVVSKISDSNLQNKIEAFKCYESVNDEHKTDQDWLFSKMNQCASFRGKTIGEDFGEAFIIDNYSPLSASSIELISQVLK